MAKLKVFALTQQSGRYYVNGLLREAADVSCAQPFTFDLSSRRTAEDPPVEADAAPQRTMQSTETRPDAHSSQDTPQGTPAETEGMAVTLEVRPSDKVVMDDQDLAYAYCYRPCGGTDRTKLMELKAATPVTDVRIEGRSAYVNPQDNSLYAASGTSGSAHVYNAPKNGSRKDTYSGTYYTFGTGSVWANGVQDLVLGKPNQVPKLYALSYNSTGAKRVLVSTEIKNHGLSTYADRNDEVNEQFRFIAVDPTNSYLFLAGGGLLQRLNLTSPTNPFTDFTAGSEVCCPPVFATKQSTTYCCTVETTEDQLIVARHDITKPSSRTTETVDTIKTMCAGVAVHPTTQNLWVVYASSPTSLRAQELDPATMKKTSSCHTGKLPAIPPFRNINSQAWARGACYGAVITP
ncbi:hypothetical protein [Streptomyces sp. NPDC017529]|uniref:hypothetical protein n=1 Tax=Streptomyces sp. NPDC017529 TaxID=3365000 RepID=UPI00378A786B